MLKTWLDQQIKNHESNNRDIYLDSPLWNNDNFKYRNNILYIKDWITHGVHQIGDILNNEGEIRTLQEITTIVGQTASRILEYNAVKTTLLQAIAHNRFHNTHRNEDIRYLKIKDKPLHKLTCRDWRTILTEETTPCAVNFWHRTLDINITKDHWEATFTATKETKLGIAVENPPQYIPN
eukprot:TRINITY_DN23432_c1_g1_i2.p1 TRINITY_DN23432_c1_g1~~TRINITY_DN23432_c1_g1_i2.p1  ORF type:complete len:180 (-),score=13.20 TRINITY_DN23432_c1_g1_i2:310-849(-)